MTIPAPNAKYNLLLDVNVEANKKSFFSRKKILFGTLLLLLSLTIILRLFLNLYFLYCNHKLHEENLNRAQVYSIDEFFHPNLVGETSVDYDTHDMQNPQPKLVCYYNYPDSWNSRQALTPENIDCNLCTHINIGFATISNNSIAMSENMQTALAKIAEMKKCNQNIKLMLSVGGGGTQSGFPDMVATHATRKEFILSLKFILRAYKLDGVDLDWEFPGIKNYGSMNKHSIQETVHARERQHFSQLLREIRSEYDREKRDYLLSVAVASPEFIVDAAYDVGEINQYVDFVNLMTYDFHFYTPYTPFTGFNSPLYRTKQETLYLSSLNINYTAHMWIRKGLDRSKLVIGLPTYAHTFTLVNPDNSELGSPSSGYGHVGNLGFASFSEVCQFIQSNNESAVVVFNNETMSPYLHNVYEWISFEDEESITSKSQFVKDNKFGGAMVYSLNSDDYAGSCQLSKGIKFPLVRKVNSILLDNDL